jgi:hypothetical protein
MMSQTVQGCTDSVANFIGQCIVRKIIIKLCGLSEMNGHCGTILAIVNEGESQSIEDSFAKGTVKLRVSVGGVDDGPLSSTAGTTVLVHPHNCMRLMLPQYQFRYDAGPLPAAYRLQVFKCGAPFALEYGVRTLESIPAGQFVCTYWGKTELNLKVSKQWGFDLRSDFSSKYTIYVESQSADRLCLGLDNMAVDPHTEGNLARWINCSCSPFFFDLVVTTFQHLFGIRMLHGEAPRH